MSYDSAVTVANIVRDAGGRIVGRTRLQKVAYLLTVTGLEATFSFAYKHFGPFSEGLASAAREADLFSLLTETENQANWGGTYSTFTVSEALPDGVPASRVQLASAGAEADAIELELAATAVYLAREGVAAAWAETARRKPEKAAQGRLERAKELYRRLRAIQTPVPLPNI
ncbi:MAG TPA: hypothetical protein VGL66_17610 [Caulobacteraceae bacterium]|jgi:hypothetical protein